jgi:hypothetical protein
MRPLIVLLAASAGAALLAGGCAPNNVAYDRQAKELADSRQTVRELQGHAKRLEAGIVEQQKQIQTLRALGPKRLSNLFYAQRVSLGRHTGAIDLDGRPGDDAIKVYLLPIDQDGSVIKAAGDVKIDLFDLAAGPQENLIGRYEWTAEQLSKQWSSGFVAYHFSFVCPWKSSPPPHDEITVRVEFTDYLTGQVFTAQKSYKVNLPPRQPAAK